MNCCIECFRDSEIREVIKSQGEMGNCDFCGSTGIHIYPIGEVGAVEDMINGVIDVYEPDNNSDKELQFALLTDWSIFSEIFSDKLYDTHGLDRKYVLIDLVSNLCSAYRDVDDPVYTGNVRITNSDDDALSEFGIVSGWNWDAFSDVIKYKNRFHNNLFHPEIMASFLSYAVKNYDADFICYRARRCDDRDGLTADKMGAPPSDKSTAGRISPEGVSVLYLASNAETALSEIRASTYDFVSVGTFRAKRAFRVVNLLDLADISPFVYITKSPYGYGDLWQYAINHSCLRDFADAVSKPLRRNDSPLDYLPTQFIAEFIKSENYDGVEYKSTMNFGSTNLAIFDKSIFECIDVKTVEVSEIQYLTKPSI
ncbi:hypothetical protein FACS1894167_09690 [Synergistales bacterium]|nr:hypothetical protein FACS1894167_09690 [Synergistales bacterium]